MFSFLPKYYVEIDGQITCEVIKEFAFFKQKYRIGGVDWYMDGDFWAHEYRLYDTSGKKNYAHI